MNVATFSHRLTVTRWTWATSCCCSVHSWTLQRWPGWSALIFSGVSVTVMPDSIPRKTARQSGIEAWRRTFLKTHDAAIRRNRNEAARDTSTKNLTTNASRWNGHSVGRTNTVRLWWDMIGNKPIIVDGRRLHIHLLTYGTFVEDRNDLIIKDEIHLIPVSQDMVMSVNLFCNILINWSLLGSSPSLCVSEKIC